MASYFIKIDQSPEVRRKLLEASKATIHILKSYQDIIVTRSQKMSEMQTLRRDLKELTMLMNKAEALLPILSDKELQEMAPKELPKLEAVKIVGKAKASAKSAPTPKLSPKTKVDDRDRLENALRRIEEQLGNI
jgi:hypothetical protein